MFDIQLKKVEEKQGNHERKNKEQKGKKENIGTTKASCFFEKKSKTVNSIGRKRGEKSQVAENENGLKTECTDENTIKTSCQKICQIR